MNLYSEMIFRSSTTAAVRVKKLQMIGIIVLRRSRNYLFIYIVLFIVGCNTSDTTLNTDLDVKPLIDFDTIIMTRTSSISPVITDTFYNKKEYYLSYIEVLNQFYNADSITFSDDPKLVTIQELNNRINIIDYSLQLPRDCISWSGVSIHQSPKKNVSITE